VRRAIVRANCESGRLREHDFTSVAALLLYFIERLPPSTDKKKLLRSNIGSAAVFLLFNDADYQSKLCLV
jgi:hypothetical protein